MTLDNNRHDRITGALLGLAAGDAVGTTVEFSRRGSFEPMTDMVGGGPFNLEPGQWTDDTSMALCLATSLVERRGFDPVDQMQRYTRWQQQGYLSSTDRCFDIGGTVAGALAAFARSGHPYSGPTDEQSSGNGSLMRLAPVPMAWHRHPDTAVAMAGQSSRTTHGSRLCIDACRYFAGLLLGAFDGVGRDDLLSTCHCPVADLWEAEPLETQVRQIADGSFRDKSPEALPASGFVLHTLEAALWAVWTTEDFEQAVLAAANLGRDADTTAAVAGQLAGALYGASGIPAGWLRKLARREMIETLAERLAAMDD